MAHIEIQTLYNKFDDVFVVIREDGKYVVKSGEILGARVVHDTYTDCTEEIKYEVRLGGAKDWGYVMVDEHDVFEDEGKAKAAAERLNRYPRIGDLERERQ